MASVQAVGQTYQRHQRAIATKARTIAGQQWAKVPQGNIAGAWASQIAPMVQMLLAAKLASTSSAAAYAAASLTAGGTSSQPLATLAPIAFAQTSTGGFPLGSLLYLPVLTARARLAEGVPADRAWLSAQRQLMMLVQTEVTDAGRDAVMAAMFTEPHAAGYLREPGGNACDRCLILAGRWYRLLSSAEFLRHPNCQCIAVPAGGAAARSVPTPDGLFHALSPTEQDRRFGAANAQAIRDGADIGQVVNAKRGMTRGAFTTTEGTTKRGFAASRATEVGKKGGRLTPSAIYANARSREDALRLLYRNGYILNPVSSIAQAA